MLSMLLRMLSRERPRRQRLAQRLLLRHLSWPLPAIVVRGLSPRQTGHPLLFHSMPASCKTNTRINMTARRPLLQKPQTCMVAWSGVAALQMLQLVRAIQLVKAYFHCQHQLLSNHLLMKPLQRRDPFEEDH